MTSRQPGRLIKSTPRSNDQTSSSRSRKNPKRSNSPQAGSTSTIVSHQSHRPTLWDWINHIPQSADDQTIIAHVRQVFSLAEQYVNNFYVDRQGQQLGEGARFPLEKDGFQDVPDEASLEDIICDVTDPTTVIKHCLIALLVSTISFDDRSEYSLLPREFTLLAKTIRKNEGPEADIPCKFVSRSLVSY